MVIRALVAVLVLMACGFDLTLESLRQREIRYAIQDVDRQLGAAELRLADGRRHLQRVIVDSCFGRDPALHLAGVSPGRPSTNDEAGPSTLLAVAEAPSDRGEGGSR